MSPELTKQLFDKYPKIFQEKDLPMSETCMCWGFEFDDGWYLLVDTLCRFLQWHADHNGYPQMVAVQQKEKYGEYRGYFQARNCDTPEKLKKLEFLEGAISFTEDFSRCICENCGGLGKLRKKGGWFKTLCGPCAYILKFSEIENKENEPKNP